MEVLVDTLADESEGAARTVARVVATCVLKLGVKVTVEDDQLPRETLSEAFGWYLGVDLTYGLDAVRASSKGMKDRATAWAGEFRLGGGVCRWRRVTSAGGHGTSHVSNTHSPQPTVWRTSMSVGMMK